MAISDSPDTTNYWIFKPLKGPSIAFAILFAISGIHHIWTNNLKYKSYRIGFLLPWAALIFTTGFILREYGAHHTDNLPIFISAQVMLFVAPPVYNGACYFIFSRALYYLPYLSIIHPGRVATTFITLDVLVEVMAGNGASRLANVEADRATRKAGEALVKASLFLLLTMFLAFFVLVIDFHRRAVARGIFPRNIKVIVYTIYVTNILILLRNCFRTAAFFYSWNSVANGKEWSAWIFEYVPMLVVTYLFNIYPPAKYMPSDQKVYLAMDGKTEVQGPGLIDKRPFLKTFFDPFDIAGIISKKDSKNRFWLKDGIGGPLEAEDATDELVKMNATNKA